WAVDWTEFDKDTVEYALSYLYIEDYDGLLVNKLERETTIIRLLDKPSPLPKQSYRCLQADLPAETIQTAATAFIKVPPTCEEGLGDVALIHAKFYYFTLQLLFSRLEDLALQRLTQLLLEYDTPTDPFFLRLTDAIRLIYNSTPTLKLNDPAR
ncbi:hypothetical protein N7530_008808, partial [Penicillium desertorum]